MARGGFREGAGRPSGSTNRSSPEQTKRLLELAKTYTDEALQTLVDVTRNGRTDAARVWAANALLDRAYGKPAVKQEQEIVDLPPVVIQLNTDSTEWRGGNDGVQLPQLAAQIWMKSIPYRANTFPPIPRSHKQRLSHDWRETKVKTRDF